MKNLMTRNIIATDFPVVVMEVAFTSISFLDIRKPVE